MTTRVHLIDDDDPARDALAFLLMATGYEVLQYSSVREFFDRNENEPLLSCVISDVRMPDQDGVSFTREVRSLGWRVPIILISGHADALLAEEARSIGADFFIEKPYPDHLILSAIDSAMQRGS